MKRFIILIFFFIFNECTTSRPVGTLVDSIIAQENYIINSAKNFGYNNVYLLGCIKRGTDTIAGFETNRVLYNSKLTNVYFPNVTAFIRVDTLSELNNPDNTTYYTDKTHLTNAGNRAVYNLVKLYIK